MDKSVPAEGASNSPRRRGKGVGGHRTEINPVGRVDHHHVASSLGGRRLLGLLVVLLGRTRDRRRRRRCRRVWRIGRVWKFARRPITQVRQICRWQGFGDVRRRRCRGVVTSWWVIRSRRWKRMCRRRLCLCRRNGSRRRNGRLWETSARLRKISARLREVGGRWRCDGIEGWGPSRARRNQVAKLRRGQAV